MNSSPQGLSLPTDETALNLAPFPQNLWTGNIILKTLHQSMTFPGEKVFKECEFIFPSLFEAAP